MDKEINRTDNYLDELAVVEDSFREMSVSKTKKKWIRCKEATQIYSMGRTKLTALAKEAGAVCKIDSTMLIDAETFDRFIETFRVRGES